MSDNEKNNFHNGDPQNNNGGRMKFSGLGRVHPDDMPTQVLNNGQLPQIISRDSTHHLSKITSRDSSLHLSRIISRDSSLHRRSITVRSTAEVCSRLLSTRRAAKARIL